MSIIHRLIYEKFPHFEDKQGDWKFWLKKKRKEKKVLYPVSFSTSVLLQMAFYLKIYLSWICNIMDSMKVKNKS